MFDHLIEYMLKNIYKLKRYYDIHKELYEQEKAFREKWKSKNIKIKKKKVVYRYKNGILGIFDEQNTYQLQYFGEDMLYESIAKEVQEIPFQETIEYKIPEEVGGGDMTLFLCTKDNILCVFYTQGNKLITSKKYFPQSLYQWKYEFTEKAQRYLQLCYASRKDSSILSIFRSLKELNDIANPITKDKAYIYEKIILKKDPNFFDFKYDDTVGMPQTYNLKTVIVSGETMRHCLTLCLLEKYFELDSQYVVEFGGGYGNLAKLFLSKHPTAKYTLVEHESVLPLIKQYVPQVKAVRYDIEEKREQKVPEDVFLQEFYDMEPLEIFVEPHDVFHKMRYDILIMEHFAEEVEDFRKYLSYGDKGIIVTKEKFKNFPHRCETYIDTYYYIYYNNE